MADEEIRPASDDEFHFSEETAETQQNVFATPAATKGSRFGKLNMRNVFIAIGIVVLLFVIYKLVGVFFETSSNKATKKTTTTQQQVQTKKTIETKQAQTNQQEVQQPQLPSKQIPGFSEQSEQEQTVQQPKTEQQIQTLQNRVNNLSNSVSQMQDSLNTIVNQLNTITQKLSEQEEKLATMKRPVVVKRKVHRPRAVVKRPKKVVPKTVYHIQAMMPGRAWLISSDGFTINVTTGSSIPGYGVVRGIYPTRGVVTTSTNAIIRYMGL